MPRRQGRDRSKQRPSRKAKPSQQAAQQGRLKAVLRPQPWQGLSSQHRLRFEWRLTSFPSHQFLGWEAARRRANHRSLTMQQPRRQSLHLQLPQPKQKLWLHNPQRIHHRIHRLFWAAVVLSLLHQLMPVVKAR